MGERLFHILQLATRIHCILNSRFSSELEIQGNDFLKVVGPFSTDVTDSGQAFIRQHCNDMSLRLIQWRVTSFLELRFLAISKIYKLLEPK